MKQRIAKILSVRNLGDLRLISLDISVSDLKPGQFFLAFHPEKDDHLSSIYYVMNKDEYYFSVPEYASWELGDQLITRGPIGAGLKIPAMYSNLLCISTCENVGGLYPVIENSVRTGKNVACMVSSNNIPLPNSVEVVFPEMLEDTLGWADYVLIEMNRDELKYQQELLQRITNSGLPAEILLYCPILCSGDAHCMVCSVKTKKGWIQTCHIGSTFYLDELEY